MPKYARGHAAWGICGRSGRKMYLKDMVFDGRFPNMRVDPAWWEPKDPLDYAPRVEDPVALWRPSPEFFPITPPVLDASQEGGGIDVSWSAAASPVLRMEGYRLYKSVNGADFTLVDDFPTEFDDYGVITDETLSFFDDTVYSPGDVIEYYVIAYSGARGAQSNTDSVTAPSITAPVLTVVENDGGPFLLSWTQFGGDVDSYEIYRAINGGSFELVDTVEGTRRTYYDWGVPVGVATRSITMVDDSANSLDLGFDDGNGTINAHDPIFGAIDDGFFGSYVLHNFFEDFTRQFTTMGISGEFLPFDYSVFEVSIGGVLLDTGLLNASGTDDALDRFYQWTFDMTAVGEGTYDITLKYADGLRILQDGDDVEYYVKAISGANTANSNEANDGPWVAPTSFEVDAVQADTPDVSVSWSEPVIYNGNARYGYDIFVSVNGDDFNDHYIGTTDTTADRDFVDTTGYVDGDELVYHVFAYGFMDIVHAISPPITYVGAALNGIIAETITTPPGTGLWEDNLFSTDDGPAGSVFGDPFPGLTLLAVFDGPGEGGDTFLIAMTDGGVAPAADVFDTITINGITFDRASALDGTGEKAPSTGFFYRYWVWSGLAGLEDGVTYGVTFT